jgi:hypothetical protein
VDQHGLGSRSSATLEISASPRLPSSSARRVRISLPTDGWLKPKRWACSPARSGWRTRITYPGATRRAAYWTGARPSATPAVDTSTSATPAGRSTARKATPAIVPTCVRQPEGDARCTTEPSRVSVRSSRVPPRTWPAGRSPPFSPGSFPFHRPPAQSGAWSDGGKEAGAVTAFKVMTWNVEIHFRHPRCLVLYREPRRRITSLVDPSGRGPARAGCDPPSGSEEIAPTRHRRNPS